MLGIGRTRKTGQAIRVNTVIIQRIAKVKTSLEQAVSTGFKLNFFQRFSSRTLADHIQQTARTAFTVKHGNRATHNFSAFQHIRVNDRIVIEVALQLQAIQIVILALAFCRKAANDQVVIGVGCATRTNRDTRRVAKRLFY